MAAEQDVLREYLVALGFKVNETEHKKFVSTMGGIGAKSSAMAKGVVGAATAVVTFTTLFAKQMERLYYASRYAGTTAGNMRALEFGAQQIGLTAGTASNALKNFTAAVRANPGLQGLLNKLGVPVKGRDMSDVMKDFVRATKDMPPYIGNQFAAMFGMDPETYFNLKEGWEKMERMKELQKQVASEMGVNLKEAAESGVEYSNMWGEVKMRAGLFVDLLGIKLMPVMKNIVGMTGELMTQWAAIVHDISNSGIDAFLQKMKEGLPHVLDPAKPGDLLPDNMKKRAGIVDKPLTNWEATKKNALKVWRFWGGGEKQPAAAADANDDGKPEGMSSAEWQRRNADAKPVRSFDDDARPVDDKQDQAALDTKDRSAKDTRQGMTREQALEMFAQLEKQYAIKPGTLAKLWKRESSEGVNMLSPRGAMGHMGFMPKTAKAYGLEDPNNLSESAEAAAHMWADVMKRAKGDTRLAAAMYNWGDGNIQKYGLGKAPKETRDYMEYMAGNDSTPTPNINQETNIHISGVSDPKAAAASVADAQMQVNSTLLRNSKMKVR